MYGYGPWGRSCHQQLKLQLHIEEATLFDH